MIWRTYTYRAFSTFVSETPCYVFYATRRQVYCRFDTDDIAFASTLIWHHTQEQIHTQHTPGLIDWAHKCYVLTAAIFITHLLHIFITDIKNSFLPRSTISLHFKNYSLPDYLNIQWLDSIRLSPSCETQRILQKSCKWVKDTHIIHRQKDDIGKG